MFNEFCVSKLKFLFCSIDELDSSFSFLNVNISNTFELSNIENALNDHNISYPQIGNVHEHLSNSVRSVNIK